MGPLLYIMTAAVGVDALVGQTATGVSPVCADRPAATGRRAEPPGRQEPSRTGSRFGKTASDLFCVDLIATSGGGNAVGVVELGRVTTPFGTAVTADGHHRHNLTAWIAGLPDPSSIGPYATYVAWATTAVLDPVIKLGEVANGENALGEVWFNKFMILITAEASPAVTERTGPLVLRGRSPSMMMAGHDLLAQAPSALQPSTMGADRGWAMPPMYPKIPILPGMMGLFPSTDALSLDQGLAARLPEAREREVVRMRDGGTLDLEAGLVRRQIGDRVLTMLAYNGQHPGPLIAVAESSTIFVNVINRTPFPTAVHWHGIRLDNRFDGVPGVTQDPIQPGATFRYQIFFPDAGIYWYHPHHREDVQQELGLYGNLVVESRRQDYFAPVNREEFLMLDDLLLDDSALVPFGDRRANYALMGRFGTVFLVNGEPDYAIEVRRGEVVRFFLTNVANTRTFNVSFVSDAAEHPALPMKVVGSDIGKFEREAWAESAVLAPAERYVIEVRFPAAGQYRFVNRVQGINHRTGTFFTESTDLGSVFVDETGPDHDHAATFASLRTNADVIADIERYRPHFGRAVDRELVMSLEVDSLPLVVEQVMLWDWVYFNPVEWAGTMPMTNWASTGNEVRWILRDPRTGAVNEEIVWSFTVGDVVKLRVYNDRDAFHAMQHPLHIHGQRFLVLEQNGVRNTNLVWKDTVLLPTGSTTDILLEITNPGRWMVHCHIAEHLESGMRFVFDVKESP